MSKRDPSVSLRHMRDAAVEALAYVQTKSREDLDRDRLLSLALVQLLQILGEAAARVPADTRGKLASIPWPSVVGLRNQLIHGYDEINLDIVWQILKTDLPPLVSSLREHLKD